MNYISRVAILFWMGIPGHFALSQMSACANPNAPRIGLMIRNKTHSDHTSSPELTAFLKRKETAEIKFRDQLTLRLPANSCVVTDWDVFSDPKNFPQLKGSSVFEISASPSLRNPNLYALAVTMIAVQGPYVEDQLHMVTEPVLIEADSDYAHGAEIVMIGWQSISEGLKKK
jgi:hypothetical protein